MFRLLLCLVLGFVCVHARVVISPNQFPASTGTTPSTFVVGFQVINACSGTTTTNKLDIHFPQGFSTSNVIPVKHTGWTFSSAVVGGNTTWTVQAATGVNAEIEDNLIDSFQFLITMPTQPGSLPFSFTQYCADATTVSWTNSLVVLSTANLGHVVTQENVFGELLSNIAIDSANAAVDAINAANDTLNAATDATNAAADATNAANDVTNAVADATNAANDATNAAADATNAQNDAINAQNDTKNAAADATNAAADATNAAADATNAAADATNAAADTTNAAADATNAAADAANAQNDAINAAADTQNKQDDATNAAQDTVNSAQDTINAAGDASVVTQVDSLRSSGVNGGGWTRADTIAVIAIIIAGLALLAMVCMYSKIATLQQNDAYLRGHMQASRIKDIEMAPMLPNHNKRSIITTVNSMESDHEPAIMSSSASAYPRETRIHLPTSQQHQRLSTDGTYLAAAQPSDVNFHD